VSVLYIASSKALSNWGEEVGITKHLYKLGLAEVPAEEAIKALNESRFAGQTDWVLVRKGTLEGVPEERAYSRIAAREKMIDPALYPKLKEALGVFKVKPTNVENHMLIKSALAGDSPKLVKIKPAHIGAYLITCARGDGEQGDAEQSEQD